MDFFDRKQELKFLEEKWNDPNPQFIVLWGKRRVGKTELVKQFMTNKPHLYFSNKYVLVTDLIFLQE